MNQDKWEKLQQAVNHLNEEMMIDNQQFMLFENADAAIEAIRSNQIPGVEWTEEKELNYQREILEGTFNDTLSIEEIAELEAAMSDEEYPLL